MHSILTSSAAALLAAAVIPSLFSTVDAFTSPIHPSRQYIHTAPPQHQLAGKKRGSFLDEFANDESTTPATTPKPKVDKPIQTKALNNDNFHNNLIDWLDTSSRFTYINPKFKILPSSLGGYGAFCSPHPQKIIQKNEMIMCIPRDLCNTFDDALNDPECGGAFRLIKEYQLPDWNLMLVAGWAAKEYLMGKLLSDDTSEIKHWPYLKTLPWKRGELDQEHVLFWTEEEVEALLEGSFAYDDAQLIRSRVQNATKLLDDRVFGSLLRKEMGLEPSDPIPGLKEAVAATFVAALSRAFNEEVEVDMPDGSTEIEEEILLIPLLDILQHSNETNTIVETYDDYIILRAKRAILPGEEIYHQYQEENDLIIPPHKFFTRYGFIPSVETSAVELLIKKSPLFFGESRDSSE